MKIKDDSNNVLETYTYGASRNRLKNETSTQRTYYAWGGNSPIVEYTEATASSTPSYSKSYVFAGSRLLSTATKASVTTETIVFHHPDRLGTKLMTTQGTSAIERQSTLPFGTALNAESTGYSNQVFTSYDRSASTGLDYAVNRTYSKGQGRFTQVDPIGMASVARGNPQSNNLYSYVRNMPNDMVDPSGLYAACVHAAMTSFLAVLAKMGSGLADRLSYYAGDGPLGGADSSSEAATHPLNALEAATSRTGRSIYPHFSGWPRIEREMAQFSGYLRQGGSAGHQAAGFVLHAIQDFFAHDGYSAPEGHAWDTKVRGNDPDMKIGDRNFIRAANLTYQLLAKANGQTAKPLSNGQLRNLLKAIQAACGNTPLQITWPPVGQPQDGGGYIGGGGGEPGPIYSGWRGYPSWYYSMWEFVNWINSIPVGDLPESDYPVVGA